jgi:hypothetical protein
VIVALNPGLRSRITSSFIEYAAMLSASYLRPCESSNFLVARVERLGLVPSVRNGHRDNGPFAAARFPIEGNSP